MSVPYGKQVVPTTSKKRTGRAMVAKYLTIHSTGNPKSTAQNERDWLTNPSNTTNTGWHIVVDQTQAIEAIPLGEVAYHAGDGSSGTGNTQSVGLEICESGDREKTLKNAAEIAAQTLKTLKLTPDQLRQHHDWSGKDCPAILRDTGRWPEFVGLVKSNYASAPPPATRAQCQAVIQAKCGFSDPVSVWAALDTHKYADDLYRKMANAMSG